MTILITGGAGFIGSHLAAAFAKEAEVRVLDDFSTGRRENVNGLVCNLPIECVFEGSVLNAEKLHRAMAGADYVFHLAAKTSALESMNDPGSYEVTNVLGTIRVLDEAQRAGVRKVFFASSAAVYGARRAHDPDTPWREDEILRPRSPYAISKIAGEQYAALYQDAGRVRTVCSRFFNVFGQGQRSEGAYSAAVPTFCRLALAGLPLMIRGNGGQTRDFIHVQDVVRAIRHVTLNEETTGVFNAGSGMSVSILGLAEKIIALSGRSSQMHFVPTVPGDIDHSSANISKLRQNGFVSSVPLEDGLRQMFHTSFSRS